MSVKSWITFIPDSLILPFRITSSKSVTLRFLLCMIFCESSGKISKSIEAQPGSWGNVEERWRKTAWRVRRMSQKVEDYQTQKGSNTCPEVNLISHQSSRNIKVRKATLHHFFLSLFINLIFLPFTSKEINSAVIEIY